MGEYKFRKEKGEENMRKARRSLAILLAVVMVLCMVPAMGFAADNGDSEAVTRIDGNNRWDTAAKTALEKFGTADKVIVARGDDEGNFADGLAASYLAKVKDAPILLTNPNSLPQETKNAIKQLEATTAYVLGGELAVSEAVFSELKGLELDVERIDGGNRFDTAAKIAREGGNVDTALVVSGNAPADSLIAGSVAFNNGYPILLVQKDNVPDATDEAIKDLGIKNTYVVGGELVVSGAVYDQLGAKARYCGTKDTSRVGTSIDVAQKLFEEPKTFSIVGRQDKNLADAVGAAVLGNPIIYVGDDISGIQEYLAEVLTDDTQFVILGGTLAVSEAVQVELEELLVPEEVELNVESVSAINKDGVTVTFPEVTEAIEDANVVVKDGEGNVIETKPMLLAEGATQADFEFVTPFAEDYEFTGVWTVNGEPYSFDAINQLAAIAAAVEDGNEVKLQAALDAAGITYEDETKMPEYLSALGEEGATESLEAVQKAISEIDENAAELGNKEAAVKAVAGAKTQAQLLAALEANFKLVNPDWIVQYDEDTNVNISTTEGLTDFEEAFNNIQEAIYAVNATEVAPEVEAAFMSLDSEKVAKARILVTNWIPAGEEDEVTIKDWALDGLALEDALIAVNNAKTNSALKSALVNLDNLENELLEKYEDVTNIEGIGNIGPIDSDKINAVVDDKFDIETVKDENLTAYRTAIAATELKNKNQRSDIQAIITQVNEDAAAQAKADVLAALNEVDSKTVAADVVALLEQNQKLNELDNKVNPAYAEAYKKAIVETEATGDPAVKFANADAVDTLVGDVNKAEDAAALLAAVNTATTPADMSKALVALEAGQESAVTDFTNLSSQEKLEVAEIVIALRNAEEGKKFADADAALEAVTTEETGAIAVRSAFINGVNSATDIYEMRAKLDNEDLFPEFFALDVAEKTEKAELVLNALLALRADDEGEEVSNFETIAEIKEAAGL